MKITKKLLAVLLSAAMMIGVTSICASAVGTPTGDEKMTVTVSTDKEDYQIEEIVTVNVSIACNYNATTFRFPVMYDASVYEMPTIINLKSYNDCNLGTIGSNTVNDGSFIPDAYTASDFGCVLVQWTGSVTGGSLGCINNAESELCFSFELKTKSSAIGKTGTIFIPSESDMFYYQAINTVNDATTIYTIDKTSNPYTFVPANANVIGEEVKLVPNYDYGYSAVVDEDNLYVYGFELGISSAAEIKQFVKATGNGTIRCKSTELGFGTCALINLQVDGVTVKTYRIVIFGDVNGDAFVDVSDCGLAGIVSDGFEDFADELYFFAGDVNPDEVIDQSDIALMTIAADGYEDLPQTR